MDRLPGTAKARGEWMSRSDLPINGTGAAPAGMPRTLFGYEVLQHIGTGAGSELYAVSEAGTRQVYALKHVVRKNDKAIRFIEQLENELAVGSKISHPVIRRVYGLKESRTLLRKVTEAALVMELFDGLPLEMSLPDELPALVNCFIKVANGLEAMHHAGYVHCDLKPNNILLDTRGNVKVIDLGQACATGTAKARIQGTPDYIAPEQVKCKPVSNRTDMFNLGATMYWALTGRKLPTLFTLRRGDNSFLVDNAFDSPRMINPGVPEALSNLVMECARTDERKRPADMGDVRRRLELSHHLLTRPLGSAPASIDLDDEIDEPEPSDDGPQAVKDDSAAGHADDLLHRAKLNDDGSADLPKRKEPNVIRSIGPLPGHTRPATR
jgi:eukaryotic-like serine/threonine-protein kinase